MRISLAGATCLIGTRLLPLTLAEGHVIVAMTRTQGKIDGLRAAGVTPVLCDIFDQDSLTADPKHFASLAVDRLAYRRQQLAARERLRQDVAHPKLARHRDRGARTPPESRGEKQYRASMRFPDGLYNLLSTAGRRHVDDDEPRFCSLANRLRQTLRGSNDNGITCLPQPALE